MHTNKGNCIEAFEICFSHTCIIFSSMQKYSIILGLNNSKFLCAKFFSVNGINLGLKTFFRFVRFLIFNFSFFAEAVDHKKKCLKTCAQSERGIVIGSVITTSPLLHRF